MGEAVTPAQALDVIEASDGNGEERWDGLFCRACDAVSEAVRTVTHAELARALAWLVDNDCYYHVEICTLKSAVLREAAARLTSLEQVSARARAKCRSCPHPPHWGLCTRRNGGTAYACGCSAVGE